MPPVSPPQRAAQYVRMSTEHQQYSTANQRIAIDAYAAARGIEIVATYEDAGKSGLTLSGRPGLRKLIADVVAGQDGFDTILVYDVSRWGRFQDADESAHLEYLCRLSGVRVEYCAEPFSNDGTPFASICKVVKRALAAEYSRELSDKVYAGKRLLIEHGFRQGGSAGIGLRRCLIDGFGNRKGILAPGEYKSIATDRVILVPGPPDEIAVVRRIYDDYLKRGLGYQSIAVALNREGVKSESGRPWTRAVVKRVLTCEKYIGDNVWSRSSFKLQLARRRNARDTWARAEGAFEGLVSRALFEKVQKERSARAATAGNDQIIARLKSIHRKHGVITASLIRNDRFLGVAAIRKRFASLITAYELAGYRPTRDLAFIARDKAARRLRAATADCILKDLRAKGRAIERLSGSCRFLINAEVRVSVTVAQQRLSQRGKPRWLVKPGMGEEDLRIAVLMEAGCEQAHAYYLFPADVLRKDHMLYERNAADIEAFGCESLDQLGELCVRFRPGPGTMPHVLSGREQGCFQPGLPAVSAPRTKARLRRACPKTYSCAFTRASTLIRAAVTRADAAAHRVGMLRATLTRALSDAGLAQLLVSEAIHSVPGVLVAPRWELVREEEHHFRDRLRSAALDLLVSATTSPRTRALLGKLQDQEQIEAAEIMVLANDTSDYFARALVIATPARGRPRHRPQGVPERKLDAMAQERAFLHREARRALAGYGRNALNLVVLEAFARRLANAKSIVAWMEEHDSEVLLALKP